MSETKLLPCPWCKVNPQVALNFARQAYSVKCRNQKCPIQPDMSFMFGHERRAISAWNARAPDPRIAAADEMAKALEELRSWMVLPAQKHHADCDGGKRCNCPVPAIDAALAAYNALR